MRQLPSHNVDRGTKPTAGHSDRQPFSPARLISSRPLSRVAWRGLLLLLAMLALAGTLPAIAQEHTPPRPLRPFLVRLREPNLLVSPGADANALTAEAREQKRDELSSLFAELRTSGLAGSYSFDEAQNSFQVELSESARGQLEGHPLVAAVEPLPQGETVGATGQGLSAWSSGNAGIQSVSSVVFVQVHSPFVWGRASVGGLSVELTLEDSAGNIKGVAVQTRQPAPNNYVKIDRTQLYFETVFVDPNLPGQPKVMIRPGDRVHVVTSGTDPETGLPATEDKRVVVDNVDAWTSYEQDRVSGSAPAGSAVIVTVSSIRDFLYLTQYLTPGSGVTYAEVTAGPDGGFSVSTFRTSTDSTSRKVDLKQGSTGFVRVRHPDGNEVYTVHGQNVLVLENSSVLHGYAFALPTPPPNLEPGVALTPRPAPYVTVRLKSPQGQVKASAVETPSLGRYGIQFPTAMISGGDIVEVSINDAPPTRIETVPLTANVDLSANQVAGTGPANTRMVLGTGRISGYITSSSFFDYLEKRVTTDSSGGYTSGQFQCGTNNFLRLQPGSFGYVGYEEARGNLVYMAFAAPTTHVMVDYPFIEGWIANGALRPQVTVRGSNGGLKHQAAAAPLLLWMVNQRLFINTYYQTQTSQYISPGDNVTVVSGSRTDTIPVDRFTAYIDTDTDSIVGEAPAGAPVRVIPANDRAARREVVAESNNTYTAGNPYTFFINYNCGETSKTEDLKPGDAGRAYLRHPNGNEVFAAYGRSMHVNQNENYVELYLYATRDLDWQPTLQRPVTLTLTPKQGAPVTVLANPEFGRPGKTRVSITDEQGRKVLIRAGDSLAATFDEGPGGLTRPVTLALDSIALVTGSPDVEANTLAGVGPRDWTGAATLNPPPTARPAILPTRSSTAYAPVRFTDLSGTPLALVRGYSGVVSFTDRTGHRIWTAWAATSYPVKITGWPQPGDTKVCGTAAPGSPIRIHDVTTEGQNTIIGTGSTDGDGNFCVTVSAPLYEGQVLLAEAAGTFSQPVVVRKAFLTYLPVLRK